MRTQLPVRLVIILGVVGLSGMAVSACGGGQKRWSVSAPVRHAHQRVAGRGWVVSLRGRTRRRATLSISSQPPGKASWGPDLLSLSNFSRVTVGSPVLVQLAGSSLARRGATIRRRLSAPVAPGEHAVLAYFNPRLRTWDAVPTQLSADRETVSATVHHFSVWDTIEYAAGWLLDTRVSAPKCNGPVPTWVSSDHGVVYVDDKNAPVRWCVGHDPKNPSTLVVKATMNRSYGTAIYPAIKPLWSYDSLFGGGPQGFFTSLLARSLAVPTKIRSTFGGELPLVPGIEVDMGFTEAQARAAVGRPLVRISRDFSNALAGLLDSAIEKAADLGDDVTGKQVAAIAAFVAIAQCEGDIGRPIAHRDWAEAVSGVIGCLKADPEATTKLLAATLPSVLPKADPKTLGKRVGEIGSKLLLVVAIGAAFDVESWVADQHLDQTAFDLSVFPVIRVKGRPRPAPVTSTTTPTVTQSTSAPAASLAVGAHFDSQCVVAWPTAPVTTPTTIQMTMSCDAVPESEFLFTHVIYGDPNLPVSPDHAQAHVVGTIVDITTSAYGYRELVVQASTVQVQ
jgi:hypothetical protein